MLSVQSVLTAETNNMEHESMQNALDTLAYAFENVKHRNECKQRTINFTSQVSYEHDQ